MVVLLRSLIDADQKSTPGRQATDSHFARGGGKSANTDSAATSFNMNSALCFCPSLVAESLPSPRLNRILRRVLRGCLPAPCMTAARLGPKWGLS